MQHAVAISSNGRYLLVDGRSHMSVLDVGTRSFVRRLDVRDATTHGLPTIAAAALSPDGRLIATRDGPTSTTLWDADTGARLCQLDGEPPAAGRGAFSPEGQYVLTREDQTVRLWRCATGERVASFRALDHVKRVAVSSGARRVAATGGPTMSVWDRETGAEQQWPELGTSDAAHPGGSKPWDLSLSADGQYALTADGNGMGRLWDTSTGAEAQRYDTGRRARAVVTRAYYRAPDGSGEHVERMGMESSPMCVALSADRRTVVTAHVDEVRLWDGETGQVVRHFECIPSPRHLSDVALSPDARTLLLLGDGSARVMDTATGALEVIPMPSPR